MAAILDPRGMILAILLSASHLNTSYRDFRSFGFSDQDGRYLGCPIRTILAVFNQQIVRLLPTKFRVRWPFRSG